MDKLKEPRVFKVIIPLSAVAVISRTFPRFSFFYYLLPLLLLFIFFAGYKSALTDRELKNTLLLFLLFGVWSALTSLWSEYPVITLSRAGYFIFISTGAALSGYLWTKENPAPLSFLIPANIIVVALSLFSLITNIPADSWSGGHGKGFMGFAGHQNTLASAVLFTLPGLISQMANGKRQKQESGKIRNPQSAIRNLFIWLLLFFNLLILVLTYSRASILSLICGVVIFLILTKKWKTLFYSSASVILIFIIVYFTPLKEKANELLRKDFPAFYSSREWLWEPSYRAALNGGLFGLGYGISDPVIIVPGTGSHYQGERYIREKGNSFLALIEETGVFGLVLFILPMIYLVYNYKDNKDARYPIPGQNSRSASGIRHQESGILLASLSALIIHSQFEAWVVGVGSIQLPLFFFYAGSLISSNTQYVVGNKQQ